MQNPHDDDMEEGSKDRVFWSGILEWQNDPEDPTNGTRTLQCTVTGDEDCVDSEVLTAHWPSKLFIHQLMPTWLYNSEMEKYYTLFGPPNSRRVSFNPSPGVARDDLLRTMQANGGYVGFVRFTSTSQICDTSVCILVYIGWDSYCGLIPVEHTRFAEWTRKAMQLGGKLPQTTEQMQYLKQSVQQRDICSCWQLKPRGEIPENGGNDSKLACVVKRPWLLREGSISTDVLLDPPTIPYDVKLEVGTQSFSAHKNVLAQSSSFFEALFKDSTGLNGDRSEVQLEDTEPEVMKQILEYIYTGTVRITPTTTIGILLAAHLYDLKNLFCAMSDIIGSRIDTDNAVDMYHLAVRFNIRTLRDRATFFIGTHFEHVSKSLMIPGELVRILALRYKVDKKILLNLYKDWMGACEPKAERWSPLVIFRTNDCIFREFKDSVNRYQELSNDDKLLLNCHLLLFIGQLKKPERGFPRTAFGARCGGLYFARFRYETAYKPFRDMKSLNLETCSCLGEKRTYSNELVQYRFVQPVVCDGLGYDVKRPWLLWEGSTYDIRNTIPCDVTIKVGTQIFPAHKVVLIRSSTFFEETLLGAPGMNHIELQSVEAEATQQILDYIYTGNIKITPTNYDNILIAAHLFDLRRLVCAVANTVDVNYGNAVDMYNLGVRIHYEMSHRANRNSVPSRLGKYVQIQPAELRMAIEILRDTARGVIQHNLQLVSKPQMIPGKLVQSFALELKDPPVYERRWLINVYAEWLKASPPKAEHWSPLVIFEGWGIISEFQESIGEFQDLSDDEKLLLVAQLLHEFDSLTKPKF